MFWIGLLVGMIVMSLLTWFFMSKLRVAYINYKEARSMWDKGAYYGKLTPEAEVTNSGYKEADLKFEECWKQLKEEYHS